MNERAVVESVKSGRTFISVDLAGAVAAHESNAVARRDQPDRRFSKRSLLADRFFPAAESWIMLHSSSHTERRAATMSGERRVILGGARPFRLR